MFILADENTVSQYFIRACPDIYRLGFTDDKCQH